MDNTIPNEHFVFSHNIKKNESLCDVVAELNKRAGRQISEEEARLGPPLSMKELYKFTQEHLEYYDRHRFTQNGFFVYDSHPNCISLAGAIGEIEKYWKRKCHRLWLSLDEKEAEARRMLRWHEKLGFRIWISNCLLAKEKEKVLWVDLGKYPLPEFVSSGFGSSLEEENKIVYGVYSVKAFGFRSLKEIRQAVIDYFDSKAIYCER